MEVKVVELPEGKDAAELAQKDPAELNAAKVAQAPGAMDYFFESFFQI